MESATLPLQDSLKAAFKPNSIAIIGASNGPRLGGAEMRLLIHSGFKGEIYPINPKESIIQGKQAYPSILDVPGPVDRASIIVPASKVLQVVKECGEKGVKVVQIYSAGFGEMGQKGEQIEREMVEIAHHYQMRIIGPNCIGTYCPSSGLNFTKGASKETGNIAFVSQSGGIAFDMVTRGHIMGIHYSKVISVGNCIDLDHSDYLEYLADDEETEIIGFYIESVRNGRKFVKALQKAASKKTVVILKGGRTASGSQSVASHTGSVAGDFQIWNALFKQTGAIPVTSIEEMLITLLSQQKIKRFVDKKIAIVGNGGGATVLATDYCEEVNIELAQLQPKSAEKLTSLGVAENGRNINPIDMPAGQLAAEEGKLFGEVVKTLCEDEEVGYLLFHFNLIPIMNYMDLENIVQKMIEKLKVVDRTKTNLIGVLRYNGDPEVENIRFKAAKLLESQGIPVFSTIEQGLDGISSVVNH
ncbi:acetate--CoA ligase family protein [Mesobacillus harenae]|uniref:acetate--CoA ligase family protein n=1 Tax=Mesobacillus harenae TaxID=2213203 RepID=UPI00158061B7|nr:CoA-binding protein [Mesobacillus harenae]